MNNDLTALNNILFEQIERVNDDTLDEAGVEKEIKKAETIIKIAKVIVDNAEIALSAQKHFDEYGVDRVVSIPLLGVGVGD